MYLYMYVCMYVCMYAHHCIYIYIYVYTIYVCVGVCACMLHIKLYYYKVKYIHYRYCKGPTELLPYLYIGNLDDAYNLGMLSELGITHVLDCASPEGSRTLMTNCGYSTVYRRMRINADDDLQYQIIEDFETAIRFIEDAHKSEGKILVHCIQGINRSAAVCIAYLLHRDGGHLCDIVKDVQIKRQRAILSNPSFRRQLQQYAQNIGGHTTPTLEPVTG